MNYRFQEMLKMVIPGLYLVGVMFCMHILAIDKAEMDLKYVAGLVKDLSSLIVFLLPITGFIVGFCIYSVMSTVESFMYLIGFPRPSWIVLTQFFKRHKLDNVSLIKKKDYLSNSEARDLLNEAKQKIDRKHVEDFYYESMLARSILGAQILITVAYVIIFRPCCCNIVCAVLLLFLFIYTWYHRNCIYVKMVFAEHINIKEKEKTK